MKRRFLLPIITLALLGCKPTIPMITSALSSPSPTPVTAEKIKIGALLDLTGSYADGAEAVKVGLEVGLEDLNNRATGSFYEIVVRDAGTNPETALKKLKELDALGIKLVVGPTTSADFVAVKDYALNHDILMISPSTTASSLALLDNVFRYSPVDTLQITALCNYWREKGIKAVAVLFRDDVWGRDFEEEIGQAADFYGIEYLGGERYATNAKDFNVPVANLARKVDAAVARHGTAKVAVELISFNELGDVFPKAMENATLSVLPWFGCSGNALIPSLTQDSPASRFAAGTGFTCSAFLNSFEAGGSATRSLLIPGQSAIQARILQKLNRTPIEYAYTAYDALWVGALAYEKAGGFGNIENLKKALLESSADFVGASGKVVLSAAGDRTTACFGFYQVVPAGSGFAWQKKAVFNGENYFGATSSITYLTP